MIRLLLSAILFAGLAAPLFAGLAGSAFAQPPVQELAPAEAEAKQNELLAGGPPELGVVWVARMEMDGKRIDIASLHASVLGHTGSPPAVALTVLRFTADRAAIEFFTRDPKSGAGKLLALPVSAPHEAFSFPVLADGTVKTAEFRVLDLMHRP